MYLIAHIMYNAVSVNKMLEIVGLILFTYYSFTVHSMIFRPVLSDIYFFNSGWSARASLYREKQTNFLCCMTVLVRMKIKLMLIENVFRLKIAKQILLYRVIYVGL